MALEKVKYELERSLEVFLMSQINSYQISLTQTSHKLRVLSVGDIIPIPSVDNGPADQRIIVCIVMNVNEHGIYKEL